jgi:hypothetical protein
VINAFGFAFKTGCDSSRGTTEREKGRAGGEAAAESERGGDDRPQGRGERG